MSTDRDVTRIVRSWLHEDAYEDADRILNLVLDEIDTTPQRRANWLARRFPPMNTYARVALGAAAVIVAALLAINLLPRTGVGGPAASPTPTPEPTPVALSSTPARGELEPGSIVLDGDFPLAIVFDVPAGWSREGSDETADLAGVHKIRGDSAPAWASWAIIANVYADPCHALTGPIDPPIGPTVDDLVTALTSMVGFESTAPTDATVDGHAGKRFELSTTIDPAAAGCDDDTWLSLWEPASGGQTARVPGALTMQFWVLDVDGTRLVMFTEDYGATPSEIAESVDILESTRFE
jgi:hypothetical protein